MSTWERCKDCGEFKEVPAYEGDGVYSTHECEPVPVYKQPHKGYDPGTEAGGGHKW